MKIDIQIAIVTSLITISGMSLAQVPPDIAAGIKNIGPITDVPNTVQLYAPLFQNQKEPYPNVMVVRDIEYGPDPANRIDVFTSGQQTPASKMVVIHVHGGAFQRGDKRMRGTPFYDNLMLWLTQQGMVGINFNYRLAPKHTWPAAHEDMAAAIRWVQANIGQYGGDPNRVALWGLSAGATLSAGYLAHPQFYGATGHGVKAAVLNSGFYDNGAVFKDRSQLASMMSYFGTDPRELQERSSVEGMKRLAIPLFISHTELDLPDAITQAEEIKKSLCDAGRCPMYAVFEDHSHVSQILSVGTADTSVSSPILQFIRGIK